MPRLVDHEQRRREITTAARRVIARGGLDAATFQTVAAEAGISVRLIQYYFGTKRDFLVATFLAVVAEAGQRFEQPLAAMGADPAPREVIRTILSAVLPLDPQRHQDALVLGAYHAAALTGGIIGPEDTIGPARYLFPIFTQQLRLHRQLESSTTAEELDAQLLVLGGSGITQVVLTGSATPDEALALLDRLLDRFL
ncbi:TetR/AcrR family transcriptional regulator [Nocardia jejuensis]|uniref:TetR/AcrR family transcriptional regulator n=1 Tax=Nocardia jejuensis TaxID=328049 RepID=UPI000835922B|nr:TetR/AcrR family transcriptional regulator [Nocardia jejuensis]